MNKRPIFHKRQLLIDRNIQMPLLAYSIGMATLGMAIAIVFFTYSFHFVNFQANYMMAVVFTLGCAIFCYSLIIVAALYISNKIAGPIYRLHKHMSELYEGKDPGPLKTREDDYFSQELVDKYNQLIQKFHKDNS